MKKTLTVGDLHGKDVWRQALGRLDEFDYLIIHCDLLDSFTITRKQQLQNLKDIIYAKKQNPDKIKLILGNHDNCYIFYQTQYQDATQCSGFSSNFAGDVRQLYYHNIECFQSAFQIGNTLWTHAGMCQWIWDHIFCPEYKDKDMSVADFINKLYIENTGLLLHVGKRRGGACQHGNIFWEDLRDLTEDLLKGYNQIVGHTHVKEIYTITNEDGNFTIFTDCLDSQTKFLELEVEE